ncbi:hypothetical protein, partial [Arcticibacter eurypsychrophilus]|uniref:hypothetical protein n=1 Tax=Arcticibacter eurypsychrophilus TaxID=1434752 RepID=UPI001B8D8E8F
IVEGVARMHTVIQPYPLQFELFDDGRYNHLDLQRFNQNEITAKKKLSNYYKNIGFEVIKGVKDLLFYNPSLVNARMDEIDLEDSEVFKSKE